MSPVGRGINDLKALILARDNIRFSKNGNNQHRHTGVLKYPKIDYEEIIAGPNERTKRGRKIIIFYVSEPDLQLSKVYKIDRDGSVVDNIKASVVPEARIDVVLGGKIPPVRII